MREVHLSLVLRVGCIKSCPENPNHEFLANRWFVYNRFIDLGNPFETVVYYLLIGRVVGFGHWDRVPMVCTLMYMVVHWTKLLMSHAIRLSGSHDFTKLLYYIVSQTWENIELI